MRTIREQRQINDKEEEMKSNKKNQHYNIGYKYPPVIEEDVDQLKLTTKAIILMILLVAVSAINYFDKEPSHENSQAKTTESQSR